MKETELAAHVVDWLRGEKWDVYQEVKLFSGGRRADIIAVKPGDHATLVWAIECKVTASLAVIDQARKWFTLYRSVAIPWYAGKNNLFYGVAKNYNVGVLQVKKNGDIYEVDSPKLIRSNYHYCKHSILPGLHPDQRLTPAGSNNGDYYTPYKNSMRDIRNFITENPGCTIGDIHKRLGRMHYASKSSFRGSVLTALSTYEKDWCRLDASSRPYRFYVKENEGK